MDREEKAKKIIRTVLTVVVIGVAAVLMFTGSAQATLKDGALTAKATAAGSQSVNVSDIQELELRDTLDAGSRSFGVGSTKVLGGTFSNSEFGSYKLYVNKSVSLYIVVKHTGGVLVCNSATEADTRALYDELLAAKG